MSGVEFQIAKVSLKDLNQKRFLEFADHWSEGHKFWIPESCRETFDKSENLIASAACVDQTGHWLGWYMAIKNGDDMELLWIFVMPHARAKGISKHLMNHLIAESRNTFRSEKIFLEVRAGNHPAIKLYESFGFKLLSRRPAYYSDGEDAFVYQLSI